MAYQSGGVHPGARFGRTGLLLATVLPDQRQNPHRGVILINNRTLGQFVLELFAYRIDAVGHPLDLIPLRGISDRHSDQRLKRLQPIKRQSQRVATERQNRAGTHRVFIFPGIGR
jgi:hypothetical protein